MRVLPDTPIWSAAFRRATDTADTRRQEMERLVSQGAVEIIGPIRQELLSGVRDKIQYEALRDRMRLFPDLEILCDDYEEAAVFYNQCRSSGIQGSSTDLLICAVAVRNDLAIFTDDKDFIAYQRLLPIRLYPFGV